MQESSIFAGIVNIRDVSLHRLPEAIFAMEWAFFDEKG